MDQKRLVEHYRDHELVCVVRPEGGGWIYTVHILGHDGDTDVLRREECSAKPYPTEIDALQAAKQRCRALVDALLDDT